MKLKHYIITFFALLILQQANAQLLTVKGQLNTRDSLRIILSDWKKRDTVNTVNGSFQFQRSTNGDLLQLRIYDLTQKRSGQREFFATAGTVIIRPDTSLILSDSTQQKLYEAFNKSYQQAKFNQSQPATARSFVLANTHNVVGAFVLSRYLYNMPNAVEIDSIASLFTPEVKRISYPLEYLKKWIGSRLSLYPGHIPPAIVSKDMDGKAFNSADLKGKYAVIDFWGTWCMPCVSGIPQMKVYHDKYKQDIQFVSIASHDQETRWRNMVRDKGMDWTQLFDTPKYDLARAYSVEDFPTKVIIDPQGKVVNVYRGENAAFYQKLDELIKGTKP